MKTLQVVENKVCLWTFKTKSYFFPASVSGNVEGALEILTENPLAATSAEGKPVLSRSNDPENPKKNMLQTSDGGLQIFCVALLNSAEEHTVNDRIMNTEHEQWLQKTTMNNEYYSSKKAPSVFSYYIIKKQPFWLVWNLWLCVQEACWYHLELFLNPSSNCFIKNTEHAWTQYRKSNILLGQWMTSSCWFDIY